MTLTIERLPRERREAVLLMSPELVVSLARAGRWPRALRVVANGLPEDATFERATIDPMDGNLRAIVSSASFAQVPPIERLPELPSPQFELVYAPRLADEARLAAVDAVTHRDLLRRLADVIDPAGAGRDVVTITRID